ncbi:putative UPF0481 protein At3g02645 isoform X3 [Cornus florida]|uniref:putative UPF0481 protein At3g02645 isoform X3 n=1 Tax=Cornus florida TaxID=4283 RepID=UPI00289A2ECE|nr:putative UPF0481 protein At3g02645 isoform X3 [Cornus florida]
MEIIDNTTRDSHGNEREDNVSKTDDHIHQDSDDIPLLNSIREMTARLPSLSNGCSIYRVPKRLREMNEKAYTPQVFSIGPFHRGKEQLQAMEEHKLRYLQSFLNRTGISLNNCIRVVKEWEERARSYYEEMIRLSSDEFAKMTLLDGCFIIEVIWRSKFSSEESKQTDYLNRIMEVNDVCKDMIILENQLPFFVLEGLFNLAFPLSERPDSFLMLSIWYLVNYGFVGNIKPSFPSSEVKHFVDLLRLCHLPSSLRPLLPPAMVKDVPIHNATELNEAGIKFKNGSSNRLLDITYAMGVLEIPQLSVFDVTESLLRNLVALEQIHYPSDTYITDYILFMDSLIDTNKDVDLLVQNGVLANNLGDSSEVAGLFNSLSKEVFIISDEKYYFYRVSEELNEYWKDPWHKWKATLKRDYFSTPWRTASTIAAIILLVLTLIQTICSIIDL